MARGVNKVILIGNLGNEPETRATQQGSMVTNMNIATDESYKDKQTGQMVPRTEWHKIVMFGRLAEIAKEYLHKGSKVYIEGRLRTQKWQGQDGSDRYTTEIVANELQMLDSKQQGGTAPMGGYQQNTAQPMQQSNSYAAPAPVQQAPQQMPPQSMPQQRAPVAADFDDDIPF